MIDASWLRPDWPAPPNVYAAVSTRQGPGVSQAPFDRFNLGARSGDEAGAVRTNRLALQAVLHLPQPPCWLRQVHGTDVIQAQAAVPMVESAADAAWTCRAEQVLAILSADCLPVLFCAADGRAIAAAHAGWRGLAAGVLEATLQALSVAGMAWLAWLGPCIGPDSYEVGEEVRAAFVDRDAAAAVCFAPTRPGHWHCDLAALARQRLQQMGGVRIYGGGFDTYSDKRFYSYRRDGARSGRFASLIWLTDST